MMKKFKNILVGLFIFSVCFVGFSYAGNTPCISIGNNRVCIDTQKNGNQYKMKRNITCNDANCQIRCEVQFDNIYQNVGSCNGTFEYNSNSTENMKVHITINGVYGEISGSYNFRNGERGSYSTLTENGTFWYDQSDDDYRNTDGNYNLDISSSPKTPSTSQFINLTINTDSDYNGDINFSLKYRSSTSNSWTNISNTASAYVSDYSYTWSNGYYRMTYSDRGYKTLTNLVKFKKTGYYRLIVEDSIGNQDYIDIHVSDSSTNSQTLNISTNNYNPSTSQYVKLNIDTDSDYVGDIDFSLKYRSSTDSFRSSISRTNSTYVSDYSSTWSNGYYKMTYSDGGYKSLSNLVKFKKSGYYRITAKDSDGNENYIDIHVTDTNSNSHGLDVTTNNYNPTTTQFIKLTINTNSNYVGNINFSLKYRLSTSDSRSSISRTSSTYISDYSSIWSDGYYRMTSSDEGYKVLSNLIKFKKSGYYRIIVEDTDGNKNYVDIRVTTNGNQSSDVEGFTQKEFEMIERIYNIRPTLINQLKVENTKLRYNNTRKTLTNTLYSDIEDIVRDRNNRKYSNYEEFFKGFNVWFNKTISLIN